MRTIGDVIADAAFDLAALEEQIAAAAFFLTAPDRRDSLEWIAGPAPTVRGDVYVLHPRPIACRLPR